MASAARGVGDRGGPPPAAAVDGRRPWPQPAAAPAALRSRLLPLPGERARQRGGRTRATRPRSCSTTTTRAWARTRRATLAVPPPPYRASPAVGVARVVCFSPRHDLTLAEMPTAAIAEVVDVWRRQTRELGARPEVRQVLCFENKGDIVGVSNPHPHGQIYATSFVWKTIEIELGASDRHQRETGRGLMADIIRAEQQDGRRVLLRGRARDRVRALLRPLRLRGLRRPQAARAARLRPGRRPRWRRSRARSPP